MADGEDDFRAASLSDIISGDVDAGDEPVVETPKPEGEKPAGEAVTTGEAEGEGAKPDPKGQKGAPPAPKDAKDPKAELTDPKAKAQDRINTDERTKRQAAEARATALERELADLKAGKQQQPQPQKPQPRQIPERPDPFTDPDGARRWDDDRQTEREQAADQRDFENRCGLSESFMIEIKGEADYREKEEAFGEAVKANPALSAQLRRSANPAKFAYEQGKKYLALKEIGDDPVAYRERLRAELEAELKAKGGEGGEGEKPDADQGEQPTQPAPKPTLKAAIPQTLAKVVSAAAAPREPGKQWNGPTPLTDIIK